MNIEQMPVFNRPDRMTPSRGRGSPPKRALLVLAGALFAALLLIWPAWANLYTDWLWFYSLGYGGVFSTILGTKVMLGITGGLMAATVVWFNLRLALRLSPKAAEAEPIARTSADGLPLMPDVAALVALVPRLTTFASLAVGSVAAMVAWSAWDDFLRYRYQQPFGEADPIFGRDIGFYFFTLPVLDLAAGWLFTLGVVSLIGSAAVYAVLRAGDSAADGMAMLRERGPRAHLLSLGAGLFLALAWQVYLMMPNLLYSTAGPMAGASYADVTARLPMLWVRLFAAVLASVLIGICTFRPTNRLLWTGAGVYALSVFSGWLYPAMLQRFSVAPNEMAMEAPYIRHNIAATRKAFGLDRVEEREVSGERELSAKDIQENQPTIQNIRLWDQQPLLDTFGQIQEIRTYYEFQSVDNDRYQINGETQQVMLSPRELASASLPNRNWINERLTFTHGFGLTVGPVAQATPEGLPVLFVKDIPPVSSIPSLKVDRPEIYFGEMSNDPVYVKTNIQEFNHPAGEENVFSRYAGDGGISVASTWRQLLFATRFADMKLLLSNDLTADSRVLFYRNIVERLRRVAPFLRFDADPYMVISEGKLFWITDAYTASDRYPYSQPVRGGINYVRNSVKSVVDAYHGDVTLYVADERDPIIQTYARMFPGILRPLSEMPAGLRSHLRYPEDIFKIQTAVYSTYHMDQPQVFYNKEDQWAVASVPGSGANATEVMEPYYTIMKLPEEQTEEFILMLPFTPQRKDNLAAWMVARADGENYGRLVVYRFPKQRLIFGPKQVMARINQDPEISRQVSLWSQHGSQVILGTLMVIPIKESLIYVQPLYLRAVTGKIPELRRVIVAADNRIAMEPTLDAALVRVFGGQPKTGGRAPEQISTLHPGMSDAQTPSSPLNSQAKMHYDRMIQSQREGDWARFGEDLKQLGSVIERLSAKK